MKNYNSKFKKIFNESIKYLCGKTGSDYKTIYKLINKQFNFKILENFYDEEFWKKDICEYEFYKNINNYDNSFEDSRRQNTSSYYTPMEITEEMSLRTLKYFERSNKDSLKVIDIASGSCNFILGYIRKLPPDLLYEGTSNVFCVDIEKEPLILGALVLTYEIFKITGKLFLNIKFINENSIFGYEIEKNPGIKKILKSGGFDIVIGNPPYLGEKGNQEIFLSLKNTEFGKKYYEGKMDIFYFFIHRAMDLLNDGGILTFITTNYFVTSDGGKKLRYRFKNEGQFLELIDFGEKRLFKSALGQHSLIFLYLKTASQNFKDVLIEFYDTNSNYYIDSLKIYDKNLNIRYFRNKETFSLIEKIDDVSNRKIKDRFDVKQGIVSGADFVNKRISKKLSSFGINIEIGAGIFVHKNENIKKLEFEDLCVKSFYKNSDISPYRLEKLYSHISILYLDRNIDEKDIPNIIEYLKKFKPILSIRREVVKGYIPWFSLQWPRNKTIFSGEKIVLPQRNLTNLFAYSDEDFFASADVYYITAVDDDVSSEEFKYLTGILNSKLYYFWLYNMGKRKGQLLEMYSTPIKEIKYIGYEGFDWQKEIVKKVNEILENKENLNLEESRYDIEILINKGYFLNPMEVEMIKEFFKSCGRI